MFFVYKVRPDGAFKHVELDFPGAVVDWKAVDAAISLQEAVPVGSVNVHMSKQPTLEAAIAEAIAQDYVFVAPEKMLQIHADDAAEEAAMTPEDWDELERRVRLAGTQGPDFKPENN